MKKGKQKIIEAAFNVILQKGIKDTSVRDIAKEAGISVGTFSYHYPNKEALFFDVFEMMVSRQDEALEKGFASNTLEEKKVALVELFKEATTNECFMKLNYYLLGEAFGQNTLMLEKMKAKYEAWRVQFATYLEEEIKMQNKRLSASLFLAMIDGVMLQLLLDEKSIDIEEMADYVIKLLYE
nr:TetR/AcrR family transcriptional regulator [uncultured Cellulosilyticum sp.]